MVLYGRQTNLPISLYMYIENTVNDRGNDMCCLYDFHNISLMAWLSMFAC